MLPVVVGQFQALLEETNCLDPLQSVFRAVVCKETALFPLMGGLCLEDKYNPVNFFGPPGGLHHSQPHIP